MQLSFFKEPEIYLDVYCDNCGRFCKQAYKYNGLLYGPICVKREADSRLTEKLILEYQVRQKAAFQAQQHCYTRLISLKKLSKYLKEFTTKAQFLNICRIELKGVQENPFRYEDPKRIEIMLKGIIAEKELF